MIYFVEGLMALWAQNSKSGTECVYASSDSFEPRLATVSREKSFEN